MDITFLEKLAPRSRFSRTRLNVLLALNQFAESYGYSPTVREISTMVEVKSHSSIQYHLEALEHEGFIQRRPRRARSARLTRKAEVALDRLGVYDKAA